MAQQTSRPRRRSVIDRRALQALIESLQTDGYRVVGPQVRDGAVVVDALSHSDALPAGWTADQDAGSYRLRQAADAGLFGHGPTAQGWKRFLYPPAETLWRAVRAGDGFRIEEAGDGAPPRLAFVGIHPCDVRALDVLDRVLGPGHAGDPGYARRREDLFVVVANCTRPGGTCFCASMGGGPAADAGFDLALTELAGTPDGGILIEAASPRGDRRLAALEHRPASEAESAAAETALAAAAGAMGRTMVADAAAVLGRNRLHPRWHETADRCLSCGNCTLVCPTCFCADIEDHTDVAASVAERRRQLTSCFALEHSYIYGGSIRATTAARYRQWLTHKLTDWHAQFGVSGCVGCGRCITWCPVGIDITEEARAIRDRDGETRPWS